MPLWAYTQAHVTIQMYAYTNICVCMYTQMIAHTCVIPTQVHTQMHTYTETRVHTCTQVLAECMHTGVDTQTCMYTVA